MPGQPHNTTGGNQWYQQPHPDEYSYNPGYGFFQKSPQIMERVALRRYAIGLSVAVFGYLFLGSLLPRLFALVFHWPFMSIGTTGSPAAQSFYYILTALIFTLALGIPFVIYASAIRIPRRVAVPTDKYPTPTFTLPAIGVGLGLSVIGQFFILLLCYLFPAIGLVPTLNEPQLPTAPLSFILCALNLTLVPALVEEFVIRGVVMQSLRRFGDGFALITSSVLFMLLHQNVVQYPNAFLMGLFIGYCVLYNGSIWTGVAIHFVNNLVVLILMVVERTVGLSNMASLTCYGIFLVVALIAIAYMIKRNPFLFNIPPSRALNSVSVLFRLFYTTPTVWMAILFLVGLALQSVTVAL